MALADTSLFIANETGRSIDRESVPDRLHVSTITIGELQAGVLAATDTATTSSRLTTYTDAVALDPIPVNRAVADRWARLRGELRDAQRAMPVNDSWIAATALHLGLPVVTQDADYDGCPGLTVIRV